MNDKIITEKNKIQTIIDDFEKNTNSKILYVARMGHKLYGIQTKKSKFEYVCIFVPSLENIILRKNIEPKILKTIDNFNITFISINKWFDSMNNMNMEAIDILFSMQSNNIIFSEEKFTTNINENYKSFLHNNIESLTKIASSQSRKFGIKGTKQEELFKFVNFVNGLHIGNENTTKIGLIFDRFRQFILENKTKNIKIIINNVPGSTAQEHISVLGKIFSKEVTIAFFKSRVGMLSSQLGIRDDVLIQTKKNINYEILGLALRTALETEELVETGFIKFPLKESKYISDVIEGRVILGMIVDKIENTLKNITLKLQNTSLNNEQNKKIINNILIETIRKYG